MEDGVKQLEQVEGIESPWVHLLRLSYELKWMSMCPERHRWYCTRLDTRSCRNLERGEWLNRSWRFVSARTCGKTMRRCGKDQCADHWTKQGHELGIGQRAIDHHDHNSLGSNGMFFTISCFFDEHLTQDIADLTSSSRNRKPLLST